MSSGENQGREPLLSEFDAPAPGSWRALAQEQLGGAPFEKLVTPTPEGIAIQPIYTREDLEGLDHLDRLPGSPGSARGADPSGYRVRPWEVAQELPYGKPAEFNAILLEGLARGQSATNILLDIASARGVDPDRAEAGEVGACGLSLACLGDLETALKGVDLQAVPVGIQSGIGALPMAAFLAALVRQRKGDLGALSGSLDMDPLGHLARFGELPTALDSLYDEMAALMQWGESQAPHLRIATASGFPYNEAGGSAVEELACALATAVAYLRALVARGVPVDTAARRIRFSLAVGPNFFMEVAKLRAARVAWGRIVGVFGGSGDSFALEIHARTGLYGKTRTDPYVNMLRTTTEAFSAVAGGAQSLHCGPFDEILRLPDTFSRRIARNTQTILREECSLDQVIDPAGGSYYVEKLTAQVAEAAWQQFQTIEGEGGMASSLQKGSIQQRIAATAAERRKRLEQRRDVLVGTNMYADGQEKSLPADIPDYDAIQKERARDLEQYRLSAESDRAVMIALQALADAADGADRVEKAIAAASAGASLGELGRTLRASAGEGVSVTPVCTHRLGAPYERLREACRSYSENTGELPQIYLANLGPLRRHKARADFSREFFSVGGFHIEYPEGQDDPAALAATAAQSGARIFVICGTDDLYPEAVPAFCAKLKEFLPGARCVLAGFPGEQEAAYREAGLDDYIFVKSNNYQVLRKYLEFLGVLPAGSSSR